MHPLQTTPIFDTNVFGDVQRTLISQADWKYLLRHRPGHGWPLSEVTALELLVGVHVAQPHDFPNVRQRIELAFNLSKGRILNDPRFLLCKEVLRIPFPSDQVPPSARVISNYLNAVRRATTINQLLTRIGSTSILAELMAGPKRPDNGPLKWKKWPTNTILLAIRWGNQVPLLIPCLPSEAGEAATFLPAFLTNDPLRVRALSFEEAAKALRENHRHAERRYWTAVVALLEAIQSGNREAQELACQRLNFPPSQKGRDIAQSVVAEWLRNTPFLQD